MHGPRIPSLPAHPDRTDGTPALGPLSINVGRVDGPEGPLVVLECNLADRRMVGVLDPKTARALGVELQRLGSVVPAALADGGLTTGPVLTLVGEQP